MQPLIDNTKTIKSLTNRQLPTMSATKDEEEKQQVEDIILDYAAKYGMVSVLQVFVRQKGMQCFKKTNYSHIRRLLAVVLVIVSNDDVKEFSKAIRFLKIINQKLIQNSSKPIQPYRCAKIVITLKKRILFNKISGHSDSAEVLATINRYFADTQTKEPISTSLHKKMRQKLMEAVENGSISEHDVCKEEKEKTLERVRQYMKEVNKELPETRIEELSSLGNSDYETILEQSRVHPDGYHAKLILFTRTGQPSDTDLVRLLQDMWKTEARNDGTSSPADGDGDDERRGVAEMEEGEERSRVREVESEVEVENGTWGSEGEDEDEIQIGNEHEDDCQIMEKQQDRCKEGRRDQKGEECPDSGSEQEGVVEKCPSENNRSEVSPGVGLETQSFQDKGDDGCEVLVCAPEEETNLKTDGIDGNHSCYGDQMKLDQCSHDEDGLKMLSPSVEDNNSNGMDIRSPTDGNQSEAVMDTDSDDSELPVAFLHPLEDEKAEETTEETEDHNQEDVSVDEQISETVQETKQSSSDDAVNEPDNEMVSTSICHSNSDTDLTAEKQNHETSKQRRRSSSDTIINEPANEITIAASYHSNSETDSTAEKPVPETSKQPCKPHRKHRLYADGLRTVFHKQRRKRRMERMSKRRMVQRSQPVEHDGVECRSCFVALTKLKMGAKTGQQVDNDSEECQRCSVVLTKYKAHPTIRGQLCFPYIGLLSVKPSLPISGLFT